MNRDKLERVILARGWSKSSGTVADAVESLIKKRLIERGSRTKPAKALEDVIRLTRSGKAMRRALVIGKFI